MVSEFVGNKEMMYFPSFLDENELPCLANLPSVNMFQLNFDSE